jgi:hypothetical protein
MTKQLELFPRENNLQKVVDRTKKDFEFDKKHPPIIRTNHLIQQGLVDKGDMIVSFDPATRLFVNKDRTIAFQNYNDATQYNKSLTAESEVDNSNLRKKFEVEGPLDKKIRQGKTLTPEEANYLKQNPFDVKAFQRKNYIDTLANGTRKSTWDLMKETAGPEELRELKKVENKFKKQTQPKALKPEPSMQELNIRINEALNYKPGAEQPKEEEIDIKQLIKEHADQRLKQEQEAYDQEFGTGGIAQLKRPI